MRHTAANPQRPLVHRAPRVPPDLLAFPLVSADLGSTLRKGLQWQMRGLEPHGRPRPRCRTVVRLPFRVCRRSGLSRLGYHDNDCPLRDDRNTSKNSTTVHCREPVCDELQRKWLHSAKQTLFQIGENKSLMPRDLHKMAMKVECIRSNLLSTNRLSECEGQHTVNPWGFSDRTVKCDRRHEIWQVSRALEHVRHNLGAFFDVLATGAVLSSVKGRKLLPMPLQVAAPALGQSEVADQADDPPVTMSLGQTLGSHLFKCTGVMRHVDRESSTYM